MNFSRLIKAMALVGLVGFGSHVLGAVPGTDNFESYTNGVFSAQEGADWTVDEADLSEIVTSLVTELGEMPECVTNYYGVDYATTPTNTKVLELNTEGEDLTYAAESADYATVLVDTLLKVVGSDTAPTIDDTEVQTAVYLNTDDEKLYAWSSLYDAVAEEYTNGWTQLSTTVTNGQWICLKIEIDYTTGYGSQEPRGRVYVDGQNAVSGDGYFVLANKTQSLTKRSIDSVSFRGTGMVDNFSVSETSSSLQFATVITEGVDMEGTEIFTDGPAGLPYQIDNSVIDQDMVVAALANPEYTLVGVNLLDGDKQVIEAWTNPVYYAVSSPTFTNNGTYYVQGTYAIVTNLVTVDYQGTGAPADPAPIGVAYNGTFEFDLAEVQLDGTLTITVPGTTYGPFGDGIIYYDSAEIQSGKLVLANVTTALTVNITGTYVSSAPAVITDNGTLAFDEIVLGGDPITVDFTGEGTVGTPGTMFLIVTEDLVAGPDFTIEVDVTATAGTPPAISGTVSIDAADLTGYDTLFIKGLATEAMVP